MGKELKEAEELVMQESGNSIQAGEQPVQKSKGRSSVRGTYKEQEGVCVAQGEQGEQQDRHCRGNDRLHHTATVRTRALTPSDMRSR